MAWFKVAMLEVYNLDKSMAMIAKKRGLRTSRFTYSLDKANPKSYSEMLVHAQNYIHMDEGALTWWEIDRKLKRKQA